MTNNPFVSIIVPFYQSESFISRCVESVLNQTFTDFELLLIDDGSTDRGVAVCDCYAEKDNRVRVIRRPHLGVSATRQCGIDSARGEYTLFCDSDDWMEPNLLKELYEKVQESPYDMVLFDYWYEDKYKKRVERQLLFGLDIRWAHITLLNRMNHNLWNRMIRRSLYSQWHIQFPVGVNYGEDLYVVHKMMQHPLSIAYIPQALYHYDQTANEQSLSNKSSIAENIESLRFVIDSIEKSSVKTYVSNVKRPKCSALMSACKSGVYDFVELKGIYPESVNMFILRCLRRPLERRNLLLLGLKLKGWNTLSLLLSKFFDVFSSKSNT